jgi:thiamine-phosphate pyrophosphorylase
MADHDPRAERRARLAAARLYLVCGAAPDTLKGAPPAGADPEGRTPGGTGRQAGARELPTLLRAAIAGGVEIVQLREKQMRNEQLVSEATAARALCAELGALLIVNDRPWVAREAGADGIHVGQEDIPPAEVRELVGPEMLVGLSTHSPEQIDAVDAAVVDYIGVGPIHETPTKPGRQAVGLELIRYAAAHAPVPFFAIGGLNASNVADALGAGATRVCVLRAIVAAEDPERTARELRELLAPSSGEA